MQNRSRILEGMIVLDGGGHEMECLSIYFGGSQDDWQANAKLDFLLSDSGVQNDRVVRFLRFFASFRLLS